jgi:hypothetical protein
LFSKFKQCSVISTAILEDSLSSACTVIVPGRLCPEAVQRFNVKLWSIFVTICRRRTTLFAIFKLTFKIQKVLKQNYVAFVAINLTDGVQTTNL